MGTLEWTGVLDNGDGGSANRLHIMMQGPGECLVDNVEVVPSTGGNRIANPGFESGLTGWVIQGNHRRSEVQASGGIDNSRCLHVRATGRGDTACNRIYIPISPALAQNTTVTLRARVRWLKGWPEFMLRTRGSYLEAAGRMALPSDLGTPGARNSRAVANAGPAIVEVVHTPVLPAANQAVVITARLSDPDGLGTVRVRYRIDPGGTTSDLAMKDDGTAAMRLRRRRLSARLGGGLGPRWLSMSRRRITRSPATARFPADAWIGSVLCGGRTQPWAIWESIVWRGARIMTGCTRNWPTITMIAQAWSRRRTVGTTSRCAAGAPWHGGSVALTPRLPETTGSWGRDGRRTAGNLGNDDSAQREQAAF